MSKLKPCPFCGGKAAFVENYRMHIDCFDCAKTAKYIHPAIQCLSCGGVMMGNKERWNHRFVCLDSNGDKVFAGDEISFILTGEKSRKRGNVFYSERYLGWYVEFKMRSGKAKWLSRTRLSLCEGITLIKEDTK